VSLLLCAASGISGAVLGLWSRTRPPAPLGEAVPKSRIAELGPGRFAIHGRVVPIETERSAIDDARCVYVERAELAGGLVRSVEHAVVAHRFYLEDESGRIEVDPARTLIEVSAMHHEGGRLAERRVRAGEEIELVCELRAAGSDTTSASMPYRTGAMRVEIDYGAADSPAILRDAIDVSGLDLEARPPSRLAAGAAAAVLSAWSAVMLLWSMAFAQ
jgi:hypothetical protein